MLQFIYSARFMASTVLDLVNNLSEGIHKVKCKHGHDDKKYETYEIKYKSSDCFLEYINFKNDLIEYKCICCNKNYQKARNYFGQDFLGSLNNAVFRKTLENVRKHRDIKYISNRNEEKQRYL